MRLFLVAALLSGCTNVHVNRAALVASTAALACDWNKTYRAANNGWRNGIRERNPMLGTTPSTTAVSAYFASTIVINAAIWIAIPPKWRSALPLAVMASQIANEIVDYRANSDDPNSSDMPICGM